MIRRHIKEHSSLLLAVGAGVGVVSTAYLAAVAGQRAQRVLDQQIQPVEIKERVRLVWKFFLPPAGAAAVTVVCVAGVKRIDAGKTLAAQTAFAVSQRAYENYRAQVVEELGEKRDQSILSKVAEKEIANKPPVALVVGDGSVACCELWTMRYFTSNKQALEAAVNAINKKILAHDYATMDDLYYELGLELTHSSGHSGWTSGRLLELEYSSILHDGKPYLAFGYNYVTSQL